MIPDRSVGLLRTGGKACFAADAFFGVNPSDIAVGRIHMGGPGGTLLHADGGDALPAGGHNYVVGEFAE